MADVPAAQTVQTWQDLAAAARRHALRSKVWIIVVVAWLALLLMIVLVDDVAVRVAGVFLLLFFVGIPLWGPTMATWLQARHRNWPEDATTWVVTSDGLGVVTGPRQLLLSWDTVTDVDPWRKGVSLRYTRAVAFIPNRAFGSPEQRAAFLAAIEAARATTEGPSEVGGASVPGDP